MTNSLPWSTEEDKPCPLCCSNSDEETHLLAEFLFYSVAWRESPGKIWDTSYLGGNTEERIQHIYVLTNRHNY